MRTQPGGFPGWVWTLLLAVAGALGSVALGRPVQDRSSSQPAIASGVGEQSLIGVQPEFFGVGGFVRPGGWAGVRVALQSSGDQVQNVVVRLHVPDPDGDVALYQRTIALNPGQPQYVWLYPRLPYSIGTSTIFTITVHESTESAGATSAAVGRQLAVARLQPSRVLDSDSGMQGSALIGLVGRVKMGLELYSERPPGGRGRLPGTSHEYLELVTDLTPAILPDAWMGLSPFDTLIWTEGSPAELSEETAQAVREWVHRGGHLVVVLPSIGERWTDPRGNRLIDITPRVTVTRRDEVDLDGYRAILTDSKALPLPKRAVVNVFTPVAGAAREEATPIIAGPDLAPIVVRRLVGTGMVTLIGIDLANTALAGRLDPRTLWHRILGQRADTLSSAEMSQLTDPAAKRDVDFLNRESVWVDSGIGSQINMTGDAGTGVLLAIIVFAVYLLVAGPLGFAALKRRDWQKHAWVAFVGAAALFTVVAWGGATALRPSGLNVRHLTFLDHVYGQSVQRAHGWAAVFLPEYGVARVALGDPQGPWRDVLAAWDDPEAVSSGVFPDSRSYVVQNRAEGSLRVPARSTVKQFEFDWAGPPTWKMIRPAGEGGVTLDSNGRLIGALTHDLPGPLTNVQMVLVQRQRPYVDLGDGGHMQFNTLAVKLAGAWDPGATIDLAAQFQGKANEIGDNYFGVLARGSKRGMNFDGTVRDLRSVLDNLRLVSWLPMIEPPTWTSRAGGGVKTVLQRRSTHGLDLGAWFTEPALLIVGEIENGPSPAPIMVDGRPSEAAGRTFVRWIYPLTGPPASPASDGQPQDEPN